MVELCQARRKHGHLAMQTPFSHMLVFGYVKDFSIPNMLPCPPHSLPPSPAPTTLLSWASWMRDKDGSLYLQSLLLYDWGIVKLFSYLSEVSVLAHSFYYTVKGMLKKRPTYPPSPVPSQKPISSINSRARGGETAALSLPAKAMQAAFGKLTTSTF